MIVYCNALQTSFVLDNYFELFSKKLSSYIFILKVGICVVSIFNKIFTIIR